MLLALISFAAAGTPATAVDECERFRPPDNITLSSESKLKADIEVGIQVFSGKTGASSDAAATYVAQQRSQTALDQGLQKYELCLARQAGMLGEWDYCMQVKTIFGGLDAISAATRCDQEAALLVPAVATAAAPTIQTSQIQTSPASTAWRHRTPLLVGTAISVVGAGVMYALAASEHQQFLATPTMGQVEADASGYRAELEGMQARANAFSYAAYGASGLVVVLGLGAVITW